MIRVLIVSSSPLARAGLKEMLRGGSSIQVVGNPGDALGLPAAIEELQPDVILMDGNIDGDLDDLPPANDHGPAILLLTEAPDPARLPEIIRRDIRGVLSRDLTAQELVAAIEAVSTGLMVLHPQDVRAMTALLPARSPARLETQAQPLSAREIEVLRLVAEGEGNKTIAWKLSISEHTVKFHIASIMSKLGASSRTEAVTIGIRSGLVLL